MPSYKMSPLHAYDPLAETRCACGHLQASHSDRDFYCYFCMCQLFTHNDVTPIDTGAPEA